MGLMDRVRAVLADTDDRPRSWGGSASRTAQPVRSTARSADDVAVERYRYLLRTAPPDAVEEAHAEAFASLTPEQRRRVFAELSQSATAADRPADDDPRTLARSATRSELRRPGFLERTLGSGGGARGAGLGTIIGGSLLGTVAGVVIGSAIADMVLPGIGDLAADFGDGVTDLGTDLAGGFEGLGDFDFGGGDF